MIIRELRTRRFRNIVDDSIAFLDGFNVFTGNNAQGKTSILEAISILGNLRSFRTRKLKEVIRFGEDSADILGYFKKGNLDVELMIRIDSNGRRVLKDKKQVRKAEEVIGCFPISSFSPEDLGIVKGSAITRRRFLDKGCLLLCRKYYEEHRRYHKALLSRNQIIKQNTLPDNLLDSYEKVMAESGTEITNIRRTLVHSLADNINRNRTFQSNIGNVDVSYKSGIGHDLDIENDVEKYERLLFEKRAIDFKRGYTTIGPHRDDVEIMIDGKSARNFASQGQQRILAITLILALIEETRDSEDVPVLLLDDVSSELDKTSRADLVQGLIRIGGQIIVTTTDTKIFSGLDVPMMYFQVNGGRCKVIAEERI